MATFSLMDYKPDDAEWRTWITGHYNGLGAHKRPTPSNRCPLYSLYNYVKHRSCVTHGLTPTYEHTKDIVKELNESRPDEPHHWYHGVAFNRKGFVINDDEHPWLLRHWAVYGHNMGPTVGVDGSMKFASDQWDYYEDRVRRTQELSLSEETAIFKMDDHWFYPQWARHPHGRGTAAQIFYANAKPEQIAEYEAYIAKHGHLKIFLNLPVLRGPKIAKCSDLHDPKDMGTNAFAWATRMDDFEVMHDEQNCTACRRRLNREPLDEEAIAALEAMNQMACNDDDDDDDE